MGIPNTIKNDFFGTCMPLAYYFCMLPDILGSQGQCFKIAYKLYTWLIYFLAVLCHISQVIKLYQLCVAETIIFDEILRNYIITSLHFTALIKCIFLRSKLSGNIFKKVMRFEKGIYNSKNEEIISVYKSTLASVRNTKTYYMAGIVLVVIFYIAAPVLREPYYIQKGNETIIIKQLPLSSWTPVDDNYWLAFVCTSAAGAYLSIFFVATDMTCYSFIVFGICQIDVLYYYISNFHRYCEENRKKRGCTQNDSFEMIQRKYIMMHQDIVRYVSDLNGSLKNIMVLDFLPCSVQIAGMIFQMMANLSVIQCILLGQFICILIARIFIYCNSANSLTVQSQNIAIAWYEIDWTELPHEIKKNIMLCILRSQKPLNITIGDFQSISLNTFLVILKGTYSFMMLLTAI